MKKTLSIALCALVILGSAAFGQPMSVESYLKQARAFIDLKRYSEAEREYINASIQAEKLGPRNPTMIALLDEFANFYVSQGNWAKAEPLFRRELDLRRSLSGDRCPEVAQCKKQVAEMYISEGRYNEAESLLQESVQYWDDVIDQSSRNPRSNSMKERLAMADCLDDLARVYRQTSRVEQARQIEQRSINIRQNPSDVQ